MSSFQSYNLVVLSFLEISVNQKVFKDRGIKDLLLYPRGFPLFSPRTTGQLSYHPVPGTGIKGIQCLWDVHGLGTVRKGVPNRTTFLNHCKQPTKNPFFGFRLRLRCHKRGTTDCVDWISIFSGVDWGPTTER